MAINLNQLSKPDGKRPVIATLFGEGGMGKTTLAAMFPKPVFIRTEDGTASLVGNDDVALFPLARSSQDVIDAMIALGTEEHDRKTLVFDSITQLATMIEHEIVVADAGSKSINQASGGYGAGYTEAAERHREIRELAGMLAYDLRLKSTVLKKQDKHRAVSNGDREILCFPQASSVAKNRFGITAPLDFSFDGGNPFASFAVGD